MQPSPEDPNAVPLARSLRAKPGCRTVHLLTPILAGKSKVTSVILRPLTLGEEVELLAAQPDDTATLMTMMSGLPGHVLRSLVGPDIDAVSGTAEALMSPRMRAHFGG